MQDLIDLKKRLDEEAENENWERDVIVSDKEKDFLENTEKGQEIMKACEMAYGYKIILKSPKDFGIIPFEMMMKLERTSKIFKPEPSTILAKMMKEES